MYAVIVENDGKLEWYGVFNDRDTANARASELGGEVVVLYHPFMKKVLEDTYGTEM